MTTTLILGASENPQRFSNRAQKKLLQLGHSVILVNPKGGSIDNHSCLKSLSEVKQAIDVITVYINPSHIAGELSKILALNPKRVIFNPGSESTEVAEVLKKNGIQIIEDCTLIMLDAGRY